MDKETPWQRRWNMAVAAVVIVAAGAVAGATYAEWLPVSRHLWTGVGHDRHAHCYIGMKMAVNARAGDIGAVVKEVLFGSQVWGPLHGTLMAATQVLGGFDYRLGVLPNLFGFACTAVFGFLTARRLVPRGGNLAGLLTALFILASPSHRTFAADFMLESLGACLSVLVLYFYIATIQDGGKWPPRLLGLTLTLLFLHKSNYYLLVVPALVAAELFHRPREIGQAVAWLRDYDWRGLLRCALRQPLNYVVAALLGFVAFVWLRGPEPLTIAGRTARVYPPWQLLTVAYAVFFLQIVRWWHRTGAEQSRTQPALHQLVLWHCAPLLLNFLVPNHIRWFFGYLGKQHGQAAEYHPLLGNLPYYVTVCLPQDFHATEWLVWLALGLMAVAALSWQSLRPGTARAVVFALVVALLALYHPSNRSRFIHTWIAIPWVLSGAGLALVVYSRWTDWLGSLRHGVATAVVASLVLTQLPDMLELRRVQEAGPQVEYASWLDMTDSYLDSVSDARQVALFSSVPCYRYLGDWTFMERYPQRGRLETHWFGFGARGAENQENFQAWLAATKCDAVVFVDRLPEADGFDFSCDDYRLHEELRDVLQQQSVFHPTEEYVFPQCGCTVTIWRKSAEVSQRTR